MKDSCVYKNINTIYAYVYLVKKIRKKEKKAKKGIVKMKSEELTKEL